MTITANPPAESTDPWYAQRAAFDAEVKATANGAETAAAAASGAAAAAQTTANGKASAADVAAAVAPKANTADVVPNTRTVAGKALSANVTLVKADVGLGNVDNTSDANKPVSTAQQAALDAKATTAALTAGLAGKADTSALTAGLATKVNTADVAGLNTVGWGRAVFITAGGTIPGGTPVYTIVIEAAAA